MRFRAGFSFFSGALVYELWRRWRPTPMPAWCSFVLLLVVFVMPASAWYELIAVFAFFPALILFSAGAHVTGRFEWTCLKIGALSYGFYIIHVPITRFIEAIVPYFGVTPETLDVWLVLLVVAITGVLTILLTRFYEQPFRRILRRFVEARAATPVTRSASRDPPFSHIRDVRDASGSANSVLPLTHAVYSTLFLKISGADFVLGWV